MSPIRKARMNVLATVATCTSAVVVAVVTIIASASFSSLIFVGPLASGARQGLWMALITAVITGAIVALASSWRGVVAIPQDRIAPILALLTASVTLRQPDAPAAQLVLTATCAILLVTLLTAILLYGLGWLRLGNLIRYIPYPVIGGFLAGSGWLLVLGGLRVMTGRAVKLSNILIFLEPASLLRSV